jgi:DNA-binding Lrp family transcriptional regulator
MGEEGISMTELGRRLEVGRGALRPRLRRMVDDGEAERIGAGLATRYRRR